MNTEESFEEEELMYEHHRLLVDPGQEPLRIDKFLMDRLKNASRNRIQKGIEYGFIKVNDQATKSNYKVRPQDVITVSMPEPPKEGDLQPENIPLDIVYEDDEVLVVNKPAGMVVHPAYQNWSGTLVNALVYHFSQLPTHQNGEGRPGLVHRIDKDTSGLLVIAKTDDSMTYLAKQFYDHSIERRYLALVWGDLKDDFGTINEPLGRSPKDRRITIVYPQGEGRHAITHYKVIERFHFVTLIECQLETGRTHQIRAHMKHIGHPLFNDATYGGNTYLKGPPFSKYKAFVDNCFAVLPRQALHAQVLGFVHPKTKKTLRFEQSLPEDFKNALEKWGHYIEHMKE